MEKFKPVYDMTPEEVAEMNRAAVERQQELLQKIDAHRAKKVEIQRTALEESVSEKE